MASSLLRNPNLSSTTITIPSLHTFSSKPTHVSFRFPPCRHRFISLRSQTLRLSCSVSDPSPLPPHTPRRRPEYIPNRISNPKYEILGEVIKAGATTINIPDTVGITLPSEFGQMIADMKDNTQGIENVVISTHCQNDLGLSTANTLSGAHAGARAGGSDD